MHELIEAWSGVSLLQAPYYLVGDEALLKDPERTTIRRSWEQYCSTSGFDDPGDSSLHIGLYPMPFIGNLETASIFVLMLNPGLSPLDYFAEYRAREYRAALELNLSKNGQSSFFFLDPKLSWTGGYQYWSAKLTGLIQEWSKRASLSYSSARSSLCRRLAVVQYVPYHSVSYKLPQRVAESLRSVQLAKSYVHEVLLPRAEDGQALIVVPRATKVWGLSPSESVVVYPRSHAAGAHLTPASLGGSRILDLLEAEASH